MERKSFHNEDFSVNGGGEKSPEEKKTIYKEMLGNSQAIFVLDADIRKVKRGKDEQYKSTSFRDVDAHGFLAGGHSRVIAAAELAEFFPEVKLVTTSFYRKEDPVHAKVYATELERLGVPKKQIDLEVKSHSTLAELVEMVKMARKENWSSLSVLTSEYHIPRTREMLNQLSGLAQKFDLADEEFIVAQEFFKNSDSLSVRFLSAEEILPMRDSRYKKIIDEAKQLPAYEARVVAEEEGLKQLQLGTYRVK